MLCTGCGQPLDTRAPRGRPARYHNAACRQRARRARLATHYHATLDTLTALETAARELRHAILAGQDTSPAHGRLAAAADDLTRHLATAPAPPAHPTGTTVTKHITKPSPPPMPASTPQPPTEQPPARVVRTINLREDIGAGWTLVQHEGEADAALWHVQHEGHPVGTVYRAYDLATNARGWEARTAQFDQVPAVGRFAASRRTDRLWRTRNGAAAGIAARVTHPPAGTATRRRRVR